MVWTSRTSIYEVQFIRKIEIIRVVKNSEFSIRQTLNERGIHRSNFYKWYRCYLKDGVEGLGPKKPKSRIFWNKIPEEVKEQVVCEALEKRNSHSESWLSGLLIRKRVLYLRIQCLSDSEEP